MTYTNTERGIQITVSSGGVQSVNKFSSRPRILWIQVQLLQRETSGYVDYRPR